MPDFRLAPTNPAEYRFALHCCGYKLDLATTPDRAVALFEHSSAAMKFGQLMWPTTYDVIDITTGESMKGRTVTGQQRRWHDTLVNVVGCVACRVAMAIHNDRCSIHHVDGRTKPHAHWYVLPLCAGHHQHGYGGAGFPGFAVHGQKVAFEGAYGRQADLLQLCAKIAAEAGADLPAAFMAWLDGSEVEA